MFVSLVFAFSSIIYQGHVLLMNHVSRNWSTWHTWIVNTSISLDIWAIWSGLLRFNRTNFSIQWLCHGAVKYPDHRWVDGYGTFIDRVIHKGHFLDVVICIWNKTNDRHAQSQILTLKAPRKPASENAVCLYRLMNTLANFSNLFLHTGKQCGPRSDCS